MQRKTLSKVAIVAFLALLGIQVILTLVSPTFTADEKVNKLIIEAISRSLSSVAFVVALFYFGYGKSLKVGLPKIGNVIWCLPCFAVAVVNFPFTALIFGKATITYPSYIWLFVLNCLFIGIVEETLFRGIIQPIVADRFKGDKYSSIKTVALTSIIFSLFHLLNLLSGASVGATAMQLGYTFLVGAMFSAIYLKTGNLWYPIILHALFDIGGLLVPTLGTGTFQDGTFWALTAIFGALCGIYIIRYLLKRDKSV